MEGFSGNKKTIRGIMISFIFIFLFFLPLEDETLHMPEPTKEIKEKIALLGSNNFHVRENAYQELKEIGWPALKGLYLARRSTDLEIRMQASRLYNSYLYITSDDKETPIPSIWFIDERVRYPKGYKLELSKVSRLGSVCKKLDVPDVAKDFYEEVAKNNADTSGTYDNEDYAKEAMIMYVKKRLLRGDKQADLKKIMNQAVENSKECVHYYQTSYIENEWPPYDWYNKAPGPMIKKENFKEPNINPYPCFLP